MIKSFPCSQCHNIVDISNSFICQSCGFLNPLCQISYYDYLGLPQSLEINIDTLETKYLQLMLLYHPDKFVTKTEAEKSNSMNHSGFLNSAYNTLKDKTLNLAYLFLWVNKKKIIEDESMLNDPKLAMQFFSVYQELDEIKIMQELKNFINSLEEKKENIFSQAKDLNFQEQSNKVRNLYIEIKYINRIEEKAHIKESYMR